MKNWSEKIGKQQPRKNLALFKRKKMESIDLRASRYIIMDFNCTHRSTHHWSSMAVYGNFVKQKGAKFEFWVPKYIDREIEKELFSIAKGLKFLISPQYSATNFKQFPIAYLVATIAKIYTKSLANKPVIGNLVKKLVTLYCIMPAFIKIARMSRESGLHVVFPTLDYMGIQLLGLIEKHLSGVTIHVRRMGSETRSPFSSGVEFSHLIKLVDSAFRNTIVMGIPTLGLLEKIKQQCANPDRIYWSPLPPKLNRTPRRRVSANVLNIGFPGTAKESKGYSRIPEILTNLTHEGMSVNVFLQKALYPWNEYSEIRSKIFSSKHTIHELDSVLSIDSYQSLLNQLDIIFLPYQSNSYLNADSGILYEAADLGIPILCGDKLGFSSEAFLNGIGFNIDGTDTTQELILKALSAQTQLNIDEYNNKREFALEDFLFRRN